MPPRLILFPGGPDEREVELRPGPNTLGRTSENDVAILHKSLSRAHARIDVDGERISLTDLGSKNGTSVDGVRVERRDLGESHALQFGDVKATFLRGVGAKPPMVDLPPPTLMRTVVGGVATMSLGELLGSRDPSSKTALGLRASAAPDRERERLRILLKVSQLLSSPAPLDEVLASMLALAFEILDIDRAAVLMVDEATGELEARAVKTRAGVTAGDAPYSRSVARWVVDRSAAALFSDAAADPRLADAGSVVAHAIKTTMAAPLVGREGTHGALYVDNLSAVARFGEEDLEFLSAFASQAAISMENAILSERLAGEAATRKGLLRFFPPAVVPAIMQAGSAGLGVIETEATALFSDISGYTELSSRMRPIDIIRLLNEYFPVMADIVFRHQGTLEKYIGDALLAVWGAPLSHADDPARAVRAAIDMQRAIRELNRAWDGRRSLAIHIGVNTGTVAAGNIGSRDYIQYATIGDATNVASRLCSVAAAGQIVVGARTAAAIADASIEEGRIELTPLGPVSLKGKDAPEPVFRVEWE